VFPESKPLLAVSRVVASAAGALAITSVLLLAVGLGFPPPAAAQSVSRSVPSVQAARSGAVASAPAVAAPAQADAASIARGRYVVAISGCNDCHTAGYSETGGKVAQSDWLLGQPVGFRGPWGVSYPANLRLTVQSMTEAEWLRFARVERLPPMPWFALRDMGDNDLRSLYRFVRSLGPKGERMPAALSPNANVGTPYIEFTPKNLPSVSQTAPAAKQGGRG
jgi:mono/diheme cytochrome c family protein